MNSTKLIRSKWFIAIFFFFYFGILWGFFQWVYKSEILLRSLYKSNGPPDSDQVVMLYNSMMKKVPGRQDVNAYYRLGKILTKAEKRKEAIKVLDKIIKTTPENQRIRLWLAIELYNQQRYREAEKHFVILLRNKTG